ncbi:MAG TPA: flavin reductase family protein [Blastocatellia bacterium]|jgi:flavin reductase (DIM6/NTAB) family NADH-FMN oxidoreductase RutF|nr:flavin reductase family protein [Blastocatellia bacterium]
MAVSHEEFRQALGRFASGVTIVTCKSDGGDPCGITVSAFSSLSLEPPLVLICIDRRASVYEDLKKGCCFAVNVLAQDQESISRRFASRDEDRFKGIGYREGKTGAPLIEGAVAFIECRVVHSYPGGDHTIFVGEVEYSEVNEGKPLLYFRGGYSSIA